MEELCDDVIAQIIQYLNYLDYNSMRLYCKRIQYLVDENSSFLEFLSLVAKVNPSENRMKLVFYSCISENKLDIAKNIFLTRDLDLFILKDVFQDKLCDKNHLQSIIRLKSIRENIVTPEFFKEAKYQKILVDLEYISRFCADMTDYQNFFRDICRNSNDAINENKLIIAKILEVFGNYDKLNVSEGVLLAYQTKFEKMMCYLISIRAVSEEVLSKIFCDACKSNNSHVLVMLSQKIKSREILSTALKESCIYLSYNSAQFLLKAFHYDEDLVLPSFEFVCQFQRDDFVILFNKYISQDVQQNMFLDFCSNNQFGAARCMAQNANILPETVSNSFIKACLQGYEPAIDRLYSTFNISASTLNRAFVECCRQGIMKSVMKLFRLGNITAVSRLECVLYSCRNGLFDMVKFATLEEEMKNDVLLNYVREKIEDSCLSYWFKYYCYSNNLEAASWYAKLINLGSLDDIFTECCKRNADRMVQFLMSNERIGKLTLERCFLDVCQRGALNMVREMFFHCNIQNNILNNGFRLACKFRHLNVTKFMYAYAKVDIHYNEDEILKEIISSNNNISDWLIDLIDDEYEGKCVVKMDFYNHRCKYFSVAN